MNLLDLMVKVGIDDQASSKMDGLTTGMIAKATVIGNAFYDATKFVAGKAVDMTKAFVGGAVESYGRYEQLVGGVDKLYGDASDKLQKYAQDAYKTSGLSANQYMEQATSFSAALINSLGGDTEKAADLADVAMRAMADNADTFGSDMTSIQMAYGGFAKANYTMLDNLKLGFAGTKEGAEQLVKAAAAMTEEQEKLGLAVDADSLSFDNMVAAIAVVQEHMGIAGTTANEAMTTIEGSVRMAQTSWENFLTAIGNGDQTQIMSAVGGIVQSIFGTWDDEAGKRVGGIINNVAPVVQKVGQAILDEIPSLASTLAYSFLEWLSVSFGNGDTAWIDDLFYSVDDLWAKLSGFFEDVSKGFSDAFSSDDGESALIHLQGILEDVWGFIDENILSNGEAIGEFLGTVASLLGTVADVVTTVLDVFGPLIPVIAGAVAAMQGFMALQGLIAFFTGLGGAITGLTTIVATFGGPIAAVAAALGGWPILLAGVVGAIVAFIATNEDAREAILNAWNAVVDFFSGIPEWWNGVWTSIKETVKAAVDDNLRKWEELKANAAAKFEELKASAIAKFNEIKTNVINKVTELKTNATNKFNEVKTNITNAINGAKDTVTNAVAGMYKAVKQKFDDAVNFIRGVPNRITEALGNVKDLLWNAGSSIINGLWDGMSNAFSDVTGWVSGIAGTIASLKGPLPYDRKVLIDNGMALMDGLQKGLERGFEQEVKPYVSGLGMEVSSSISAAPVAAAPVQKGVTVQVGELVVREEADVRRIAEQLYDISNRGTAWSTSYSAA